MRILFVIIFTTFLHRGCNFTLLGIYSNLLLLAQGHFHNYICLWIHIGQSEVIFFSSAHSSTRQNTMAPLHSSHSVIWKAVSDQFSPFNRSKDLRLNAWNLANRVLVQEKNNCQHRQHVSAEKAVLKGETVEQTSTFAVTCL